MNNQCGYIKALQMDRFRKSLSQVILFKTQFPYFCNPDIAKYKKISYICGKLIP